MGANDKENTLAFLEALTDSLGDSECLSNEEIVADLQEEGIDVNAAVKRICTMVENASQQAKRQQLENAKQQRLALSSKKPTHVGEFVGWTKEQLIEKINELLSTDAPLASVSYRELESQSQDDLAALLEDIITTKELAKQESPNED